MSEDWNSGTLDDILADVQRMTREREEAQAMEQTNLPPLHWSMDDVDVLLGLDDPLAGISDYTSEADVFSVSEQNAAESALLLPEEAPDETDDEADGQTKVMPAVQAPQDDAAEEQTKIMPAVQAQDDAADGQTKIMPAVQAQAEAPEQDGKTRVLSPSRLLHKKQKAPKEEPRPEVDGQIMLQGFETEEPAQELDEEIAALELHSRRAEQVKDFKLYDLAQKYDPDLPPKTDIFEPEPEPAAEETQAEPDEREYRRFGERMQIGRFLQENRRSAFFASCGLLLIEIALIDHRQNGRQRPLDPVCRDFDPDRRCDRAVDHHAVQRRARSYAPEALVRLGGAADRSRHARTQHRRAHAARFRRHPRDVRCGGRVLAPVQQARQAL